MSFLSEMDYIDSGDTVSFNTGTIFDLSSGKFQPGLDGEWYLNGGLTAHINTFGAQNGHFKSTTANSYAQRSRNIYADSDMIILDDENSLDKDKARAERMAEELAGRNKNQIIWLKGIDYDLETFDTWLNDLCIKKESVKKDITVKTPFFDEKTGEQLSILIPTYVFVDSLTELVCAAEEEMLDGEKAPGIGNSKINTVYMADGNRKTMFIRSMRRRCQKYGIVFICTGHYDKTINMDMYAPNPKETLFGKQDWKMKGCGSKLKFLSSIYARLQASLLVDSNKEPMYGNGMSAAKDLHEVCVVLERCKSSNAGEMVPYVESQSEGLLNAVTNYHFLKQHEYYGLLGNKQKQQPFLMPDTTISRNTIREIASASAEVRRALEIAVTLCFIKTCYNTATFPYDFNIEPQKLFDQLNSDKNKSLVSDILHSRGYWTYQLPGQKNSDDLPYMSIFRIMELAKAMKK